MLTESELMQRIPVWNALSDLFLDTELSDTTHRSIAKVVTKSGFEAQEIHGLFHAIHMVQKKILKLIDTEM